MWHNQSQKDFYVLVEQCCVIITVTNLYYRPFFYNIYSSCCWLYLLGVSCLFQVQNDGVGWLLWWLSSFVGDGVVSLSSSLSSSRKVAVIGTTGKLGRTVISQLSSQNIPVRCLLRHPMASLKKTIHEIIEESTSLEVRIYSYIYQVTNIVFTVITHLCVF